MCDKPVDKLTIMKENVCKNQKTINQPGDWEDQQTDKKTKRRVRYRL